MEFLAEIKRTSQTKKASLDNEFQVVFVGEDPRILDLGKLPPDTIVKVTIEISK